MQVKSYGIIEKASKLAEGEIEVVVSTNALDAHGERINVEGIDLKDYKKNPVVLWAHDGFNLPIAKATRIWKDNGKLMAKAAFDMADEFAVKVYNKIKDGFLNAVSIGGMVDEWGQDGITISRMTMKEFSVVPVPANSQALVTAKSLSDEEVTELDQLASKALKKRLTTNGLTDKISVLKTLVATLEEVADGETNEKQADDIKRRVVLRQAQVVDKHVETIIVQLKGQK